MAKRFIDTAIFDDEWFFELSIESKLFWIYYLTKCDHAGILKFNKRKVEFETGIKKIEPVLEQFNDRILKVNEFVLFCPKFIEYQYPNFPNSKQHQQQSAIEILKKYNLFDGEKVQYMNSTGTVQELFNNSYVNVNGNVDANVNAKTQKFDFRKSLIDYGFDPNLVDDWIKVRKGKGAVNTETAFKLFIKEIESRSCNLNDVLKIIVGNSWQGFKFEWIDKLSNNTNGKQSSNKFGKSASELLQDVYDRIDANAAKKH